METITIPRNEYLELINLYELITKKINKIKEFEIKKKRINTLKYCGVISLDEDALLIQKQLRDEWE